MKKNTIYITQKSKSDKSWTKLKNQRGLKWLNNLQGNLREIGMIGRGRCVDCFLTLHFYNFESIFRPIRFKQF